MGEPREVFVLFCRHDDFTSINGDLTVLICNAVNKIVKTETLGAQKFNDIWGIVVRSHSARETLLQTGIKIDDVHITLHMNLAKANPKVVGERVVIRDYPLWESDVVKRVTIGSYSCRIWYASRDTIRTCQRCHQQGHNTTDLNMCDAYIKNQPDVHFITRGILSNFEKCRVSGQYLCYV